MEIKPIIFNGDMVRAILAGRKKQTRRVIKGRVNQRRRDWRFAELDFPSNEWVWTAHHGEPEQVRYRCPYQHGDLLWVRETFLQPSSVMQLPSGEYESFWTGQRADIRYSADGAKPEWVRRGALMSPWRCKRPSIHMPRWASRLTLEVTDAYPEPVQDITELNAVDEGINQVGGYASSEPWENYLGGRALSAPSESFRTLWDSINAKRGYSWESNPWVWVIEFRPIFMNIDDLVSSWGYSHV